MPINIRQNPTQAALKSQGQDEDEHKANTFVAFHDMDQPAVSPPFTSSLLSNVRSLKGLRESIGIKLNHAVAFDDSEDFEETFLNFQHIFGLGYQSICLEHRWPSNNLS